MPRNRYLSLLTGPVPAGAALFFTLMLLMACSPVESSWTADEVAMLNRWIDANPDGPSGLLSTELENDRSAVFVQDHVLRADSIDLMTAMVPSIYDAGVRTLGVFFLEGSARSEIEAFMAADSDKDAERLLRIANSSLGYSEYCDFLLYIQDFNQRINNESDKLQVLGLGTDGQTSVDLMEAMLTASPESSAPVFLWVKPEDLNLLPAAAEGDEPGGESGSLLILAHHFPGNGIIEETTALRAPRDRSFAFKAGELPFSAWENLSEIPEAEIIIVTPFTPYAVTPIENFITLEDVDTASDFFADPGNENMPASQVRKMNRQITQAARQYARSL